MISFPNAKINLGLHVTRRRDDGFHDIETVFYPVPICDTLEIYPSDERDSSLKLYGTPVHGRGENLSMKAFRLLKKEFDLPPIEIHLLKHIPSGAGMGGGSSDAAHTLIMLNNQFDLDLSLDVLEGFARQLGADCAFFIRNKPVFAFDRGDHFRLVDKNLSGKYLLIVKPDIHISTHESYGIVNPQT
jgi:4-diphosphocytidyl-2-C-methyl-D-erythritol kinase